MDAPGTRERDDEAVGYVPPPPAPPGVVVTGLDERIDAPFPDAHHAVAPHADRWAWRHKVKTDPTLRKVYRGVVAFVGVALMVLAATIGWLPGPAGIPLFLLGLAILASEFDWAHRLLQRTKVEAHKLEQRARHQPRWVQWVGGLGTLAGVVLMTWAYLALLGVPGWLPAAVTEPLLRLPAVEPAG